MGASTFSVTSWRFFTEQALIDLTDREGLFLTYVLAPDDGFKGDLFVFPIAEFADCVRRSDKLTNGKYRVYISRTHRENPRWYMRRKSSFTELATENVIDVTKDSRDFACLGQPVNGTRITSPRDAC